MIELKSSTIVEDYVHVYVGDRALDLSAEPNESIEDQEERARDLAQRIEVKVHSYQVACETNDPTKLPLKADQEPTLFHLRHPTGTVRAYLHDRFMQDASTYQTVFATEAVACCLVKISAGDLELEHMVDRRFGCRRLTTECLRQLTAVDGLELVLDLGNRIVTELYLKKKTSRA